MQKQKHNQNYKYRTPKEVRKLWIENLTNGKYRHHSQGQFYHCGRHCALGVLQDMLYKDGRKDLELKNNSEFDSYKDIDKALKYMGLNELGRFRIYNLNDSHDSYEPVVKFLKSEFDRLGLSY